MAKTKKNNLKNVLNDTLNTVFKPLRPENYIFGGKQKQSRRKTRKNRRKTRRVR